LQEPCGKGGKYFVTNGETAMKGGRLNVPGGSLHPFSGKMAAPKREKGGPNGGDRNVVGG